MDRKGSATLVLREFPANIHVNQEITQKNKFLLIHCQMLAALRRRLGKHSGYRPQAEPPLFARPAILPIHQPSDDIKTGKNYLTMLQTGAGALWLGTLHLQF